MPFHHRFLLPVLALVLPAFTTACTSPRDGGRGLVIIADGGSGASDPSCWDPSSIVPDITCGSARPDVVCPGSCAQTLDGIVGVGLSSCRCMDTGSGFGAQWVCDTTGCDDGTSPGTDGGGAPRDAGAPGTDAGVCAPVTFERPAAPGCTTSQRYRIMAITSQAEYDAFVADPANDACNNCMTQSALACATVLGCDDVAGELMCCLDDRCGSDDTCRNAAFTGACATETNTLQRCISSIGDCALNPLAPPSECFP